MISIDKVKFYIDKLSRCEYNGQKRKALFRLRGIVHIKGERVEFLHKYFQTKQEAENARNLMRSLITKMQKSIMDR